mmetsp:Transcript_23516/g.65988  ORF Transcript_23516/g.65988 Transcript_23516/m.65988 type:complete len:280 (+) Transcript_23516:267-1106(+)
MGVSVKSASRTAPPTTLTSRSTPLQHSRYTTRSYTGAPRTVTFRRTRCMRRKRPSCWTDRCDDGSPSGTGVSTCSRTPDAKPAVPTSSTAYPTSLSSGFGDRLLFSTTRHSPDGSCSRYASSGGSVSPTSATTAIFCPPTSSIPKYVTIRFWYLSFANRGRVPNSGIRGLTSLTRIRKPTSTPRTAPRILSSGSLNTTPQYRLPLDISTSLRTVTTDTARTSLFTSTSRRQGTSVMLPSSPGSKRLPAANRQGTPAVGSRRIVISTSTGHAKIRVGQTA